LNLRISKLAIILFIVLAIVGCSKKVAELDLTTKKLHTYYAGDIQNVDYIELRDGTNGELIYITEQVDIDSFVQRVSELDIVPNPNQSGGVGFKYNVTMFENNEVKLTFTNHTIVGMEFIANDQFMSEMDTLFSLD